LCRIETTAWKALVAGETRFSNTGLIDNALECLRGLQRGSLGNLLTLLGRRSGNLHHHGFAQGVHVYLDALTIRRDEAAYREQAFQMAGDGFLRAGQGFGNGLPLGDTTAQRWHGYGITAVFITFQHYGVGV